MITFGILNANPAICMAFQKSQKQRNKWSVQIFYFKICGIEPPGNLSFRPIVAGPACETYRLSNFLDILLQPYAKYVKSYIKDTKDFLDKNT